MNVNLESAPNQILTPATTAQTAAVISPSFNTHHQQQQQQHVKHVITLPKGTNINTTNINTPNNSNNPSPQIITLLKNQNGLAQLPKVIFF